jgi:hypothetical protein
LREQTVGPTYGGKVAGHTLASAVLPLCHEARPLEDGHVLLHGGKGHVVPGGQLGHGRFRGHHPCEDLTPRGVGEGPEQLIQRLARCRSIYNHLVVYRSTLDASNWLVVTGR